MFAEIGGFLGFVLCLGFLVFRWKAVAAKYGSLSLYWWLIAVTSGCTIAGYVIDGLIWGE